MKIIFDTNVLLSGFLTKGFSFEVLDYCISNFEVYISNWIKAELFRHLENKFKLLDEEILLVKNFIDSSMNLREPKGTIPTKSPSVKRRSPFDFRY